MFVLFMPRIILTQRFRLVSVLYMTGIILSKHLSFVCYDYARGHSYPLIQMSLHAINDMDHSDLKFQIDHSDSLIKVSLCSVHARDHSNLVIQISPCFTYTRDYFDSKVKISPCFVHAGNHSDPVI